MTPSMIIDPPQELAFRASDGLEVALFWRPSDAKLTVSVTDRKAGSWFELPVAGDHALDAFYHPFAYRR